MHNFTAYLIFWLPQGYVYEPNGDDQRFAELIVRYFQDVSGSRFLAITSQYGDASGSPSGYITLGGVATDRVNPYPHAGTWQDPLLDSDIQAEVGRAIQANGWTPTPDSEFFVFTGAGIESCNDSGLCSFPTGSGDFYGGYHKDFLDPQTGQQVVYAYLPDVATHLPSSGTTLDGNALSPNHDWMADSEISVTSHEQFESITDPYGNAWGDDDGQEIGDKCVRTYGTVNQDGSSVVLNGDPYIVQEEWSNAAGGCALST
jgi:hypothetical protein